MIKNRSGYELLEYIPCKEEEISNYKNITSAGIIYIVNNKILIGFNNWRMQWEIPAGRIEKEETPREAAERELYEETHQKVNDMKFSGLFKRKRPNGELTYIAIYLSNEETIMPFIKSDNDEFDTIKLWDLNETIGYVDEVDLEIIKIALKTIKYHKTLLKT